MMSSAVLCATQIKSRNDPVTNLLTQTHAHAQTEREGEGQSDSFNCCKLIWAQPMLKRCLLLRAQPKRPKQKIEPQLR